MLSRVHSCSDSCGLLEQICFRKNYPTTRVVLDCMELFIERPSSCRGQSATFSSYKKQGWIYCVCVWWGGGGCTSLSLAKGGEGGVLFFMIKQKIIETK